MNDKLKCAVAGVTLSAFSSSLQAQTPSIEEVKERIQCICSQNPTEKESICSRFLDNPQLLDMLLTSKESRENIFQGMKECTKK